MTCVLYRVYDGLGHLLYVGTAVDPSRRFREHLRRPFMRNAARVRFRTYPTTERARAVEKRACMILSPIWNRTWVRESVQARKEAEAVAALNAADPKAKPIKSLETWRRWVRDGCPGVDD